MHLRNVKRTSGVPCLWTSVVPHTYVKTVIAPPYLALRISLNFRSWISPSLFSDWSSFVSWLFHWLHISSFTDLSAPLVCPAAVQFPACFYFLWKNFKNSYCSNGGTEILNQLPSSSFGLIYMSESLHGTHLWWHCPFKTGNAEPSLANSFPTFPLETGSVICSVSRLQLKTVRRLVGRYHFIWSGHRETYSFYWYKSSKPFIAFWWFVPAVSWQQAADTLWTWISHIFVLKGRSNKMNLAEGGVNR